MKYQLTTTIVAILAVMQTAFAQTNSTAVTEKYNQQLTKQSTAVFEENKGQMKDQYWKPRPDVLYYGKSEGMNYYIRNNGISYQLSRVESWNEDDNKLPNHYKDEKRKVPTQIGTYRVDAEWQNANANFTVEKGKALDGYNNYYNVPEGVEPALFVKQYESVTLKNLWNDIDVHYYGSNGYLENDYIVAPGADYKQIKIAIKGAKISTDKDGNLIMKTPFGEIREGKLKVYQNHELLDAKWVITPSNNGGIVSFEIPRYNPALALRIDPLTRIWGTYYGNSSNDYGRNSSTDVNGNIYLSGYTYAATYIASGGHQNLLAGSSDAFLVKFNSSGTRLWATYYGGTGVDFDGGCATDGNNNVYLSGQTESSTNIASNGHQNSYGGGPRDAYLVKFNTNGVRLWGTYYGGSNGDQGSSCAADGSGNVYLSGYTSSTTNISSGGHQISFGGGNGDAFLVKFNTNGVRLWGSYYGGSSNDNVGCCTTDGNGNVYLNGMTASTTSIASSGHQNTHGGSLYDAYLVKFNSNGVRLWGTYYGGSGEEFSPGYCVTDGSGNVFLSGLTASSNAIASSGFQNTYAGGSYDAFLVKFNANGVRQWGTYYGGSDNEDGVVCATDASSNVYLLGSTTSSAAIASGGYSNVNEGGSDAFLVKFNTSGSRQWGTYYGGVGNDYGYSCVTDVNGNIYIAGYTGSTSSIASGGYQSSYGGAFLVQFRECSLSLTLSGNTTICDGQSTTLTASGSGTFTWSNSLGTGSTKTVSPNITTQYTVTATDINNCSVSADIIVMVNASPLVNITGNNVICAGQSTSLTASGGSTYQWSNSLGTGATKTVAPTATTTYTVTAAGSNGCTASTSKTITVNSINSISLAGNSPICNGQSTTLTASGGNTYTWSNGLGTGTTKTVNPTATTSYTVTGTDANSCTATASKTITVNPKPVVSITPATATTCSGQNTTLTAAGAATYVWSNGTTTAANTVAPTASTTYTVTGTDANGCTNTANRTVNIFTTPAASISSDGVVATIDTINPGEVLQLQLNASLNANPNIQWSPNIAINNTSIANPHVYPSITTTYTVTFTNTNGCQQTTAIQVYVKPMPLAGNVSINSPASTIGLFDTLVVNVHLTNVANLYGLFMKLKGNAAVNNYLTYVNYTAGTLLGNGGNIISTPPTITSGVYDFGITKVGAQPGYSGSGLFYTFRFVTKNTTIPNGTQFCFYLDDINANNASGSQVGLTNQGPYCYTFTDQVNVWPGDLNNSKTVTTADLLPIGYFYNSTGPTRPNATIQWTAQPSTLWGYGQTPNGSAYKVFADANGDGIISNADQTAIGFNMGKIHAMVQPNHNHEERASDGALVVTPASVNINPLSLPQTLSFDVSLNNSGGLSALYGISVNLLFDNNVFDLTTATVDYTGSIFGSAGTDCLVINYTNDSVVSLGLTRYANAAINGQGLLFKVTLQTRSSIPGINTSQVLVYADAVNNQTGDPLSVDQVTLAVTVGTASAISDLEEQNTITVYPNPATDMIYIQSKGNNEELKGAKAYVYNSTGQLVGEEKLQGSTTELSTQTWGVAGLYTIEIRSSAKEILYKGKLVTQKK